MIGKCSRQRNGRNRARPGRLPRKLAEAELSGDVAVAHAALELPEVKRVCPDDGLDLDLTVDGDIGLS